MSRRNRDKRVANRKHKEFSRLPDRVGANGLHMNMSTGETTLQPIDPRSSDEPDKRLQAHILREIDRIVDIADKGERSQGPGGVLFYVDEQKGEFYTRFSEAAEMLEAAAALDITQPYLFCNEANRERGGVSILGFILAEDGSCDSAITSTRGVLSMRDLLYRASQAIARAEEEPQASSKNIKAIETSYKGYRFRSRLEARWAVFFDALGIRWEYEKEGYDLGDTGYYLPDFWLPDYDEFVEIKPDSGLSSKDQARHASFKENIKPSTFTVVHGLPITFRDDDRQARFDEHLNQMILIARLNVLEVWDGTEEGAINAPAEVPCRWRIEELRKASSAARSARFEFGESGAGISR